MNREELHRVVSGDLGRYMAFSPSNPIDCTADLAAIAIDIALSAVADDLLRIATDDNRVGLYAEAHGVSRAAGHLRSLIEEGKTND